MRSFEMTWTYIHTHTPPHTIAFRSSGHVGSDETFVSPRSFLSPSPVLDGPHIGQLPTHGSSELGPPQNHCHMPMMDGSGFGLIRSIFYIYFKTAGVYRSTG
uniref:Uncharacterized protein n=1 Tax=Coccidioides posadasii RMSCC 3488 TaxID=454284 RepID=A0A0J6FB88_COCPO|nr:hypothetical protein CPAG_06598 [Coccidioides posadasii RMSCC 3488]